MLLKTALFPQKPLLLCSQCQPECAAQHKVMQGMPGIHLSWVLQHRWVESFGRLASASLDVMLKLALVARI